MTDDGTVSKSEFARLRGVSPAMVTKWVKASRLVMVGDRVDAKASTAALGATLDPARGGKGGKSSRPSPPPDVPGPPLPGVPSVQAPAAAPGSYETVRTTRESFVAKQAELDYLERVGALVERHRVEKAIADALAPILSGLDSMSARVGPALAAETDVRRIQNIVDDAVAGIRQEVADTLRRMVDGNNGTRQ